MKHLVSGYSTQRRKDARREVCVLDDALNSLNLSSCKKIEPQRTQRAQRAMRAAQRFSLQRLLIIWKSAQESGCKPAYAGISPLTSSLRERGILKNEKKKCASFDQGRCQWGEAAPSVPSCNRLLSAGQTTVLTKLKAYFQVSINLTLSSEKSPLCSLCPLWFKSKSCQNKLKAYFKALSHTTPRINVV